MNDLRKMLNSNNRSLRKRAFQYIEKDEPSLQINAKDLLKIYEINTDSFIRENIPLSEIQKFYPSIMAEIYLWLHLRGDKSALLGANVYDLDPSRSLDIDGILKASIKKDVPLILQSSFNAIGQFEKEGECEYNGYLNIENGPSKLVSSCISSSLKAVLLNGDSYPFYGIGLDHVDSKNDFPKGRANRFLDNAINTGNITHIVLGSDAFNEIKLWKNGSELLRNYKFIIISRLSSDIEPMSNIKIIESLSDISSSDIREKISENISVLLYTPIEIHNYIKENNLYR